MTKISKIWVFVLSTASAFGQSTATSLQSFMEEARQNNAGD